MEDIQTYLQRVLEEKEQLDEKIANLYGFTIGHQFGNLDVVEQNLLKRQLECMKEYAYLLGERISLFTKSEL